MTIDEAIDNFEREIVEFEGLKKIRAVTHEDYAKIERIRQFVEWLMDYKRLKEQEPSKYMAPDVLNHWIGAEVFDRIREEFISLYPKNYAGEPELGGSSCEFSLNKVLNIIDKYKPGSEVEDEDR